MTEVLRPYVQRDDPKSCKCGEPMTRLVSLPHCSPDGIYSYAPNVGSEADFERRRAALRDGVKSYKKDV